MTGRAARLVWFAGIWAMSVAALGVVSLLIKFLAA